MKLVNVTQMQAIEREANEAGLSYETMMENAGTGLASVIAEEFNHLSKRSILGLVGPGNNGGDALVALSLLSQLGWEANAYLVRPRPEDDSLVERFRQSGGTLVNLDDDISGAEYPKLMDLLEKASVVLDGVLGTGTRLPLRDGISQVLGVVQSWLEEQDDPPYVVAVDCPSGIDSDTGDAAPEVIPADITVTMAAVKTGLLIFPASRFTGEIRLAGIGLDDLPEILPAWNDLTRMVVDDELAAAALPARPDDAHKGTFGTALIVAGSVNYTGAALLAAESAYRVGAGLVTLAVPGPLHIALSGQLPEATWVLLPHEMGVISEAAASVVKENISKASAVLIGPGFGVEEPTRHFLQQLLSSGQGSKRGSGIGFSPTRKTESSPEHGEKVTFPPAVFDADGLKLLVKLDDWTKRIPPHSILTPHPGEMAILTGLEKDEIQSNRLEIAEQYAIEWGHVVVLKGAFTVIADPDGRTAVIPVATAALARAGTGDVLSGIIAGLRAQGVEPFSAAMAGAWIHAQAGLAAADWFGNSASVLAGDVMAAVPDIVSRLYMQK